MYHQTSSCGQDRGTNQKRNCPSRASDEVAADPATDNGLRLRLTRLVDQHQFAGADWEAIGTQLLWLAERDAWRARHHSSEFISAFLAAAIELLRQHPQTVLSARSPWGLVVTKGRCAGRNAAGAEATCGLTDRDPGTHHVRFANLPLVVSLDSIVEAQAARAAS